MTGPDEWQTKLLTHLRDKLNDEASLNEVLQCAIAAGHGVGKSGCVAWLILWAMATRGDTRGVVTANTETQLRTKTWAELAKWFSLCIFRPWFELNATSIISRQPEHDKTWRIDAIPWSETNTEAFAGLHNQGKRIMLIFDEASAIDSKIWEVAEGAMTDKDTQIIWLAFGNPTRATGRFYDCFGRLRHRWFHMHVDSRDAAMSNKKQLAAWEQDYGVDSDFFRVRVRGEFPNSSDTQFISSASVDEAMRRESQEFHMSDFPVAIVGVDIAMYGDDSTSICTRVGREVLEFKTYHKRGLEVCGYIQEHVEDLYRRFHFERVHVFMDAGGVGQAHVDLMHKMGYKDVIGVNFGGKAEDARMYKNKRAEMWGRMKQWIEREDPILPYDDDLKVDLTGPEYFYDTQQRLQLESKRDMKERGLASPDKADSLALTFAQKVFVPPNRQERNFYNSAVDRVRKSRMVRR